MVTTTRNRKLFNVIMVALAVVIVGAGIAFFLQVRGGGDSSSPFTVSSKIGNANIERAGISYALDKGTTLQEGDVVETLDGSEIGVKGSGDTTMFLADASKLKFKAVESATPKTGPELLSGCAFIDAKNTQDPLAMEAAGSVWTAGDAVFVSDVHASTLTVQVLAGELAFGDGQVVKAGESRTIVSGNGGDAPSGKAEGAGSDASSSASKAQTDSTMKVTLGSLETFALEHAREAAAAGRGLVFTEDQIASELQRRENERTQLAEQATAASQASAEASDASAEQDSQNDTANADEETIEGDVADTEDAVDPVDGTGGEDEGSVAPDEPSEAAAGDEILTCTLQIRCDTILDNMGDLAAGKSKYVPRDGMILNSVAVEFTEGESAFDVLKRACDQYGISVEYSFVPIYGSYYIEGIGNLYEFDCGDESGWMFKVNGWFPNYGCSEYALSDGDAVVFCYTCRGLGEDVGA